MTITQDKRIEIDTLIDAVTNKRNLKLTIAQLLDRYPRYINQILRDKERLMRSGYDWAIAERDMALYTVFTDVHAARTAAEGKGASSIHRKEMEEMCRYHEILSLVVEHVIDETNDETVKAAHAKIKREKTQADTLHDILAMISLLKEHHEIAITFTPDGVITNEEYLDRVSLETQTLLEQNGAPVESSSERAYWVDRQQRVITLCLEAIDRMKKYAKGAFFMDKKYYRKHYTLNDFHLRGITNEKDEETKPDEQIETPPIPDHA